MVLGHQFVPGDLLTLCYNHELDYVYLGGSHPIDGQSEPGGDKWQAPLSSLFASIKLKLRTQVHLSSALLLRLYIPHF